MLGKPCLYCFVIGLIFIMAMPSYSAWEIGGKAGYDSNVNRAIDGAVGDTSLGAYLQYSRGASGETRFDWTLAASLEGNTFLKNNDLSNAGILIAPGIIYFPYLSWSLNIYPFVQGKVVSDNEQSALSFGAKIDLKQPINKYIYIGEYYVYTDSRAQEDVYSSTDHALGISLGINWTNTFFTELGYEYSHGDSFRTFESSSTVPASGKGKRYGYSTTFATEVYKDQVSRHSVGFTMGMELFPSVSSSLSYMYSTMAGDLGNSDNHTGLVGISYRF
ncbi:MAG: hypothetical protein ABFD06_11295 [Smithella sp.]|jgi:hypothetical protein